MQLVHSWYVNGKYWEKKRKIQKNLLVKHFSCMHFTFTFTFIKSSVWEEYCSVATFLGDIILLKYVFNGIFYVKINWEYVCSCCICLYQSKISVNINFNSCFHICRLISHIHFFGRGTCLLFQIHFVLFYFIVLLPQTHVCIWWLRNTYERIECRMR